MRSLILCLILISLPVTALATPKTPKADAPEAKAILEAKSGSKVAGLIEFTQRKNAVVVRAEVSGLAPGATHGFHISEAKDCATAGKEAGALGNIEANKKGMALTKLKEPTLTLKSIIGKTVVIDAAKKGSEIACGVIKAS